MKTPPSQKSEILRKTWPKIRTVFPKGEKGYQIDARRAGTNGKQHFRATLAEAEKLAADIAKDFAGNGNEGLTMHPELRAMATTGERMLAPLGKTILQACEFYRDFLLGEQTKRDSALVPLLAAEWHTEKKSGKYKKLSAYTLKDIKATADILIANLQGVRILEVTSAHIHDYLDKQDVGMQRKYNLCNLLSQFFNWAIEKEHITKNPCAKINIEVGNKDVSVFNPGEAEAILRLCESDFPDFVLYHAISLFAGLRPEECQFLQWEQIHFEERTITVLAETSKVNETHNVHIEDNLLAWLIAYKPKKAKGYVTSQTNFKNYTLQIHISAGFKGQLTITKDGVKTLYKYNHKSIPWPQDVMRHSYGSYWLTKYGNRAQLAENMANSVKIIRKHYKRVVSKSDTLAYWVINPKDIQSKGKRVLEDVMQTVPTV